MKIIEILPLIIGLILKIWDEILSAKAIAKAEKREFELSKKKFLEFADRAILKMRDEAKVDSSKISDLEDRIDSELRK